MAQDEPRVRVHLVPRAADLQWGHAEDVVGAWLAGYLAGRCRCIGPSRPIHAWMLPSQSVLPTARAALLPRALMMPRLATEPSGPRTRKRWSTGGLIWCRGHEMIGLSVVILVQTTHERRPTIALSTRLSPLSASATRRHHLSPLLRLEEA